MNFRQMKTEVYARLEENSSNPVFWTDADIGAALNEGYEEISDGAEWSEQTAIIDLKSDQIYYNLAQLLPGNFLRLLRGTNEQTKRPMEWESVRGLDTTFRRWEVNVGEPMKIFVRGLWQLGIYPHVSADRGTIRINFAGIPLPLAGDTDTPAFPRVYHVGLVEYAAYDLLCQEAETDKALKFWQRYVTYEAGLRNWVKGRLSRDRVASYKGG